MVRTRAEQRDKYLSYTRLGEAPLNIEVRWMDKKSSGDRFGWEKILLARWLVELDKLASWDVFDRPDRPDVMRVVSR